MSLKDDVVETIIEKIGCPVFYGYTFVIDYKRFQNDEHLCVFEARAEVILGRKAFHVKHLKQDSHNTFASEYTHLRVPNEAALKFMIRECLHYSWDKIAYVQSPKTNVKTHILNGCIYHNYDAYNLNEQQERMLDEAVAALSIEDTSQSCCK